MTANLGLNAVLIIGLMAGRMVHAAAVLSPVRWSVTEVHRQDGKLILEVSAAEQPGFHIYALRDTPFRPTATVFQTDDQNGSVKVYERVNDFASGGDKRSLRLTQHFLLAFSGLVQNSLTIGVRYAACTKKVCYPPIEETILVPSLAKLKHAALAERMRTDYRLKPHGYCLSTQKGNLECS